MRSAFRGVGAGDGPVVVFGREDPAQTFPQRRLVCRANLKAPFLEPRPKRLAVCLHPQGQQSLSIRSGPNAAAFGQEASGCQVGEAPRHGTERDVGLLRHRTVWGGCEVGPNEDGHDGLDPRLVHPARLNLERLRRTLPFDVNEEPFRCQMGIAYTINVVDAGPLQSLGVLGPNVRREHQEAVPRVPHRLSAATTQLVDHDRDVLEAQMRYFLDEVADWVSTRFQGEHPVEVPEPRLGQPDDRVRYPRVKTGSVRLEILSLRLRPLRHVRHNRMFINNEQGAYGDGLCPPAALDALPGAAP